MINYLFNYRPDILDRIVYHTDKKSIIELLPKLLNFDNIINITEEIEITRKDLISKMIIKLNSDDFEVNNNLAIIYITIFQLLSFIYSRLSTTQSKYF